MEEAKEKKCIHQESFLVMEVKYDIKNYPECMLRFENFIKEIKVLI